MNILQRHTRREFTYTLKTLTHPRSQRRTYSFPKKFSTDAKQRRFPTRTVGITLGGIFVVTGVSMWLHSFHSNNHTKLDDYKFVPATLQSSEPTGKDAKVFRLQLPLGSLPDDKDKVLRPIWSINFKHPDIQIERAYTPLEGVSDNGEIIFWIKKYDHGEMGRWLHERESGSVIEVRRPERTWEGNIYDYDHVIMIAGGTGVTPFYQLLHSVFSSGNQQHKLPRLTLLQSYRNVDSLPPKFVMENLESWSKLNGELKIVTFFDGSESDTNNLQSNYKRGRISQEDIDQALHVDNGKMPSSRIIVLISGPESMITALAGERGRNLTQGPVGGALAHLGLKQKDVWKL